MHNIMINVSNNTHTHTHTHTHMPSHFPIWQHLITSIYFLSHRSFPHPLLPLQDKHWTSLTTKYICHDYTCTHTHTHILAFLYFLTVSLNKKNLVLPKTLNYTTIHFRTTNYYSHPQLPHYILCLFSKPWINTFLCMCRHMYMSCTLKTIA